MLVKGITNPFFSKMIEIIEDEAKRKRYALVLRHVEAQEDELDVALELEKEKRLRGDRISGRYDYGDAGAGGGIYRQNVYFHE